MSQHVKIQHVNAHHSWLLWLWEGKGKRAPFLLHTASCIKEALTASIREDRMEIITYWEVVGGWQADGGIGLECSCEDEEV